MEQGKVKAFSKLNKKGKVVRVIREHYLRDDIWCKSCACTICNTQDAVLDGLPNISQKKVLFDSVLTKNSKKRVTSFILTLFPALTSL